MGKLKASGLAKRWQGNSIYARCKVRDCAPHFAWAEDTRTANNNWTGSYLN
jgi:hypothetical protein